ncbi:MFS transporter [Magnetofaba australis]|uniref:MFS transporter n=1 Tax=Magnetofaba australis TaxID=1472297 RepID=UPI000A19B71D|nr:MFS transporter [Magnetofaba australis]
MQRKASIGIIFFTVFLDLLGFGMVLPLMPLYASDPRFLASPAEIGWLMAIYSLMQFLCAPLWGGLSDRIGRRPVLIIGLFGSALSYLIYGLAESFTILMISRAVAGVMGANIAAAQAAMADLTPPEKRAQGMGIIGAAFGLGFVVGPALGGLLSQHGAGAAPLAAAAVTLLNAIAAIFLLAETKQAGGENRGRPHPLSLEPWRTAGRYPAALALCLLGGLYVTLFASFEVVLPLWAQEVMAWREPQAMYEAGKLFAYVGIVMVLVQGGLVRRLAPKLGEKKLTRIGIILVFVGWLLLGMASDYAMLLGSLALTAVGAGLVNPGLSSLVSLNTNAEHQGVMMGLFQSMSALGRVLGPLWGGFAFAPFGGHVNFLAAIGLVVVFILFWSYRNRIADARERQTATPAP